jgi:hypothetical protein
VKKIAPTLRALMLDLWAKAKTPPPTKERAGDAQVLRISDAELRALLAVASASRRIWCGCFPDDAVDRDHQPGCTLGRALARLDRASGRKP